MITVKRAILHSFDIATSQVFLSDIELDLEQKRIYSYVKSHMNKIINSPENKTGSFLESSSFQRELKHALPHNFVSFSQSIAQFIFDQLKISDKPYQTDILVCEFTQVKTEKQSAKIEQESSDFDKDFDRVEDEEMEYFSILLLKRKEVFVHSIYIEGSESVTEVVKTDVALPGPSQKADSYAIINLKTHQILYKDNPRVIAGMKSYVLAGNLLGCTGVASPKEVIDTVIDIATSVADMHGMNSAVIASRAKSTIARELQFRGSLDAYACSNEIFEENTQLVQEFSEIYEPIAGMNKFPQEVQVQKNQVSRITNRHRIKTNTGIEISFPSDFVFSDEYIEFQIDEDGRQTILIKNVGSIENK